MERPNNNHSPNRDNTNIEPPINQPPQQPQSSHGGNTVQPPPPAHMYNQDVYSYNTNNMPGTSQPPQPTHFGHVGNTARLPPPAHMNNRILFCNNTNNAPCNTNPPRPTQFSCGGNTAIIPAWAHMNNQPHSMNSVPWNSQPSQPLTHGAHTAMPTPSACVYTQHSYGYNTNRMPWNSEPPQPPVHGPDTAMPTPPASVNTHHSYGYSTNNLRQKSQPQQQAQSIRGGNSAIQRHSLATNVLSNQYPVPQSQMYPAVRTPQPVLMSQNCSRPSLPAPSSVQSHALQAQSSSVMTQGQGHLHVTSPSIYLLPAQQSQCQQSLPVSASQNQTACHTSPSALSKTTSPQPDMPSSGGSSTVSGQLTSCQNQSTPSTSVMAWSSQGQPLPGSTQTTAGCSLAPLQNHIQASLGFWLQCVNEWYPDRHKKTYFLPHLFFRKTQHRIAVIDHLGHLPVLVPEPPPKKPKLEQVPLYPPPLAQTHPIFPVAGSVFTLPHSDPAPLLRFIETDVLDDDAAERLLRCLRVLSKEHHEVMMVISQLDFRKYLDNNTDPINAANNAAACANLPRPVTMQQQQHHDGDFDVLIIHRHYGLMVCEVKAVGADRRNTPDLNKAVVGKVQKAVKQLNKAKTVLNHLMSDMGPVQVTKTLVLPNVTSAELMQALSTAPQLQQDLCTCLDANNIPEAISRCLCADQIPTNADLESLCNQGDSPGDTNQSTSSSQTSVSPTFPLLSSWWKNMTSQGAGPDPQMSDTVYDKLLARLCGPATTVEVPTVTAPRKAMAKPGKYTPARKVLRTEGEAVAETGLIHSLLALYPDQVDLLSDNTLRCVHLRGPPGTGKTIVLVLKAIQWLHQGHDVHVVSVTRESDAVSFLIERQLQCVLGSNPASGFGTVHRHAVQDLPYFKANKLAALASDGELYVIADEILGSLNDSPRAVRRSVNRSVFERFINTLHPKIPSLSVWCASVQKLNCPPSWMCERQLTTPLRCPPTVTKEVAKSKEMKESDIPSYSPTPAPAATEGPPVRWLPHKSGQDGHGKGSAMKCDICGDAVVQLLNELGVGQSSGPDSLQYRDVLLLVPSEHFNSQTLRMINRIQANGVPVQILLRPYNDDELRDVALAGSNQVTVSDYQTVSGLERRVVIGTGSAKDERDMLNRLHAMSRCTAQLVWIGPVSIK
ncbi:uncharacterized protein [Littorina saxatilis]|uniref:Uncharacterized protein n=1 Tax=Littorina saxatilis TaxID=31220 RepID=A0AAN9AQL2_9CAEN